MTCSCRARAPVTSRRARPCTSSFKQLQAYTSEVLPYLFLWYPQEIDVLSSSLKGVPELGLRDAMHYLGEWWLAPK